MSEKDRFDWNDDVEFSSENDAMEDTGCFESSLEGFEDYDDLSDYEDSGASDAPAEDAWASMEEEESSHVRAEEPRDEDSAEVEPEEAPPAPVGKAPRARVEVRRRSGLSAIGMGFLFAASILVAGVGVGGAILFAEGVDPASLWQPQNLLKVDQLLNFSEHPLNIIYMVSLGITFLALLGSYRMGKLAVESNARTRAAEEMLDKVCALRFDEQEAWRDESFKDFPPAEEFVIKTLGAWRLQEARQKRLLGVEGEIHRLEKALAGGERSDLTGRYDSPAVGRLVDEMLRHFDAREAAVAKAREVEKRDESAGRDVALSLREVREWNWTTRDRIDEIGHETARLGQTLAGLTSESEEAETGTDSGLADVLTAARRDLAALEKTLAADGPDKKTTDELNDLVDRGSKLAFQIAMEVTRLGPRGDRLAPMSQSLEDLTTGIRKAVDGLPVMAGSRQAGMTAQVATRLDAVEEIARSLKDDSGKDLADALNRTATVAAGIAGDLDGLAGDFADQDQRLQATGLTVAELSGHVLEEIETPDRAVHPDQIEPLGLERQEKTQRPVDTAPAGISLERTGEFTLGSEPVVEAPLSDDPEEVYDLGGFGASPLEEESADEPVDEVFELDSFGASPLDEKEDVDEPADEPADEVFELDSFGASPLDGQEAPAEADEEVFDLDQFGAAPLETAAPGAGDEEEVFELDDFGGAPVVDEADDAEPVYEMADLGGATIQDEQGADDPVMSLDAFGAVPLDESGDQSRRDDGVFDLDDFGATPLD